MNLSRCSSGLLRGGTKTISVLLIIFGVRGAGKSTILQGLEASGVCVIRPSTSRPRRLGEGQEYYYLPETQEPPLEELMWHFFIGPYWYGVTKPELEKLKESRVGVTVFHAGSVSLFPSGYLRSKNIMVHTVGLDTVATFSEQAKRVGVDPLRLMTREEFRNEVAVVRDCDAVLSGTSDQIIRAMRGLVAAFLAPGVLGLECVDALIEASCLLRNADKGCLQNEGYKIQLLGCESPNCLVQPYQSKLLHCEERAAMPKFARGQLELEDIVIRAGLTLKVPHIPPGQAGPISLTIANYSSTPIEIASNLLSALVRFEIV